MTTARTLITKAMQKLGVITKNEVPSADEANDGLDALNGLLSAWSNEALTAYTRVLENFTLTAGVSTYTMGPSGDFNTARPIFIATAYFRQNNIDLPIEIVPDETFANIIYKPIQGYPYFMNTTNGYPLTTIKLFPVPSEAYSLFLLSEKELEQFTIDETVSLPPGWERALIYNLAVEMAPDYGQAVSPELMKLANTSKGSIVRAVLRTRTMDCPNYSGGGAPGNIFTGYWWG